MNYICAISHIQHVIWRLQFKILDMLAICLDYNIIYINIMNFSDNSFFLPSELEPHIPKKQRQRSIATLKHTSSLILNDDRESPEEKKECSDILNCHRNRRGVSDEDTPSTEITPEMEKASNQGLSMIKSIIFPSLPAILQDAWVYLELMVSIAAFAFGIVDIFPIESKNLAFKCPYFALATISTILALTDGYLYFFQRGSCARGVHACRKKMKERKHGSETDLEKESNHDHDACTKNKGVKFWKLSKKSTERLNSWFELGRNITTEILLYPLLMFDMFDFITDDAYQPKGTFGRTNFGLFVIGGFYLILSVYIMRVFMVAGSMISLLRIPSDKTTSGATSSSLLVNFCAHVCGQIVVHFMIILVLGVKIFDENRQIGSSMNLTLIGNETVNMTSSMSSESGPDINASPFLIIAIILGGIIPLTGVLAFFVVNYYWMKEFSIGFWINMVSLLRGKSFAEAVFGGEGLSEAKSKVQEFLEKSKHQQVKKQFKRFKAPSFWTKFFFPARIPLTALSGLLYDIILLCFVACLMLTTENGSVKLAVFSDDNIMTVVFMISATTIILANVHVLILLNIILLVVVVIFILAIGFALFLSPILLFVYFPVVIYLGYFMLFYEAGAKLKNRHQRSTFNCDLDAPSSCSAVAFDGTNDDFVKYSEAIKVSLSREIDLDNV